MWKQLLAFLLQAVGQAAVTKGVEKLSAPSKNKVNTPSGE